MEKSGQSVNYPRMPTEMQEVTHTGFTSQTPTGPPSYEQAIHTTTSYPPVEVLHTPNANETLKSAQEQKPKTATSAPTAGANTQHHTYQSSSAQYGATNMGGVGGSGGGVGGIPPPNHMYMPNASATQQPVVIIQQHVLPLGPEPTTVTCPACHITKLTRIDYEPSARTHLMAAILCIVGLWCCVCLPYCAESCMSTNHYCGNCNKFLGTYNGGGF
ncbi:lipopolysaccharide-induced tumor necrosis factor-alpha factor homolog [Eurosta solidaginis]|uniref:lipopolysaccharide-induced tumor necrosis factor-alpha factor homolog n=1 Tax=Eurosta solidaginis TaxID=178769 RepID=UPI003531703D